MCSKKVIYRQWEDEAGFQLAARTLIARLDRIAPAESEKRPRRPTAELVPLPIGAPPARGYRRAAA